MKHFTALVHKAKIRFQQDTSHHVWSVTSKVDVSHQTYLAYSIDSGNIIRFNQSEYN